MVVKVDAQDISGREEGSIGIRWVGSMYNAEVILSVCMPFVKVILIFVAARLSLHFT